MGFWISKIFRYRKIASIISEQSFFIWCGIIIGINQCFPKSRPDILQSYKWFNLDFQKGKMSNFSFKIFYANFFNYQSLNGPMVIQKPSWSTFEKDCETLAYWDRHDMKRMEILFFTKSLMHKPHMQSKCPRWYCSIFLLLNERKYYQVDKKAKSCRY